MMEGTEFCHHENILDYKKEINEWLGVYRFMIKISKNIQGEFSPLHQPASKSSIIHSIHTCISYIFKKTITTIDLAVSGSDDTDHIYFRMSRQSHCKLFSGASRSRRWVAVASVHWSTPSPQPPWHSLTHIYTPCVRSIWGEVRRMCSASMDDHILHPANACHRSDCTDQAVKFPTLSF